MVLNSLTGDLLQASLGAVADFGTFVEIGKRDILDSGLLDMRVFSRGVTFTAFDLSELYWSREEDKHRTVTQYVCSRSGKIMTPTNETM